MGCSASVEVPPARRVQMHVVHNVATQQQPTTNAWTATPPPPPPPPPSAPVVIVSGGAAAGHDQPGGTPGFNVAATAAPPTPTPIPSPLDEIGAGSAAPPPPATVQSDPSPTPAPVQVESVCAATSVGDRSAVAAAESFYGVDYDSDAEDDEERAEAAKEAREEADYRRRKAEAAEADRLRRQADTTGVTDKSGQMKKYDVFLSHKQTDAEEFVQMLQQACSAKHYRTYLDKDHHGALSGDGEDVEDLKRSVQLSRVLLFVCSSNVFQSEWCLKELAWAKEFNVPVVTVRRDGKDEWTNPDGKRAVFPPLHVVPEAYRDVWAYASQVKMVDFSYVHRPSSFQWLFDTLKAPHAWPQGADTYVPQPIRRSAAAKAASKEGRSEKHNPFQAQMERLKETAAARQLWADEQAQAGWLAFLAQLTESSASGGRLQSLRRRHLWCVRAISRSVQRLSVVPPEQRDAKARVAQDSKLLHALLTGAARLVHALPPSAAATPSGDAPNQFARNAGKAAQELLRAALALLQTAADAFDKSVVHLPLSAVLAADTPLLPSAYYDPFLKMLPTLLGGALSGSALELCLKYTRAVADRIHGFGYAPDKRRLMHALATVHVPTIVTALGSCSTWTDVCDSQSVSHIGLCAPILRSLLAPQSGTLHLPTPLTVDSDAPQSDLQAAVSDAAQQLLHLRRVVAQSLFGSSLLQQLLDMLETDSLRSESSADALYALVHAVHLHSPIGAALLADGALMIHLLKALNSTGLLSRMFGPSPEVMQRALVLLLVRRLLHPQVHSQALALLQQKAEFDFSLVLDEYLCNSSFALARPAAMLLEEALRSPSSRAVLVDKVKVKHVEALAYWMLHTRDEEEGDAVSALYAPWADLYQESGSRDSFFAAAALLLQAHDEATGEREAERGFGSWPEIGPLVSEGLHRKSVWAAILERFELVQRNAHFTAVTANNIDAHVQAHLQQLSPRGWIHLMAVFRALWKAHLPPAVAPSLLSMPKSMPSLTLLTVLSHDAVSVVQLQGLLQLVQPARLTYLSHWPQQLGGGEATVWDTVQAVMETLSVPAEAPADPRMLAIVEQAIQQLQPRSCNASNQGDAQHLQWLLTTNGSANGAAPAGPRELQLREQWSVAFAAGALSHCAKSSRTRVVDALFGLVPVAATATVLEPNAPLAPGDALTQVDSVSYHQRSLDAPSSPISVAQRRAAYALRFLRQLCDTGSDMASGLQPSAHPAQAWSAALAQLAAPACAAFVLQMLNPSRWGGSAPTSMASGLLGKLAKSSGMGGPSRQSSLLVEACSDALECVSALRRHQPVQQLFAQHKVAERFKACASTIDDDTLRKKITTMQV